MADTALKLVLLGQDRTASKALKGVGREAGQTHGKLDRLKGGAKIAGAAVAAGLAVAATAAVDFAGDSLKAFADAEKSQKQLEDAYKRFPRVQNVTIESLRKYNQALQRKTGADADDIAAGQATLAMFKLTGKQIKETTPLLVDYATKTGKSIPDSSKLIGKALLGNTRALKDLGISYKSTGDPAKDYANIMGLLKDKVGGYAESIPDAERKQKILQASFGDLQETVGEKLQPAMLGLVDAGQGVLDWLDQNPAVLEGASAAWDLLMEGLKGVWFVISKFVAPAIAWYLKLQVGFINGTADMIDAMNQVPGLGDLIPDDAADKLRDVGKGIWSVANGLQDLGKEPPIDTGAEVAKTQVKELDTEIKKLRDKKIKLKSEGDTSGVQKIEDKIAKLKRKKHEIKVGVGLKKSGYQKATVNVSGSGRAALRYSLAGGHPSFPGGLAIIGEGMGHSPEIVELPSGSRVHSPGQSQAMRNQARTSAGGGTFVQQIYVKGDTNPNAAARRIAKVNAQTRAAYGPGWRPVKNRG